MAPASGPKSRLSRALFRRLPPRTSGVWVSGHNLVIQNTAENLDRLEEMFRRIQAKIEAKATTATVQLQTRVFTCPPYPNPNLTEAAANEFLASTVDVMQTFLYAEEGKEKAAAEGRTLSVDAAKHQIAVTDTPARLRRVAGYLYSLDQSHRPRGRQEVIKIRHVPSDSMAEWLQTILGLTDDDTSASQTAAADLTPLPEITSYPRTDALIVRYENPADMATIRDLIQKMDVTPEPPPAPDPLIQAALVPWPSVPDTFGIRITKPDRTVRDDLDVEMVLIDLTTGTTTAVRREVEIYLLSGQGIATLNAPASTEGTLRNGVPDLLGMLQDAQLMAWEKGGQISLRLGPHVTLASRSRSSVQLSAFRPRLSLEMTSNALDERGEYLWALKVGPLARVSEE